MNIYIRPYIVIFLFLFATVLQGQSPSFQSVVDLIQDNLEKENYYEALYHVETALKYKRMTDSLHILGARAAEGLNAYPTAEKYYRLLIERQWDTSRPELNLKLADILYKTGRYREAIKSYTYFINVDPGSEDEDYARSRLAGAKFAQENRKNTDPLIKIISIPGINTSQSEFAPAVVDDTMYFSSLNFLESGRNELGYKRNIGKIVQTSIESWNSPEIAMPSDKTDKNAFSVNPSISPDGSFLVFNKCEYRENSSKLRCKLYWRQMRQNGDWAEPRLMPSHINRPNANSIQPCVSYDSAKQSVVLYYSSDVGGENYQIYRCYQNAEDLEWSTVEALDHVNTDGQGAFSLLASRNTNFIFCK